MLKFVFLRLNCMNKNLILSLFALLLFPSVGYSQKAASDKKFSIGIATGFNFAFLNRFGPYKEDDQSLNYLRIRGGASIFFQYKLHDALKLQTGIGYANYGGQFREEAATVYTPANQNSSNQSSSETYYFKDVYRMDFLEIPLMGKFYILPEKQISPYVSAGMSYGILLRASNYYNFNDISVMQMDDIKPYTNKYFVNYILGVGVEILQRKRISFGLDIRYHKSLTKVFSAKELDFAYPDPDNDDYEYVSTYNVDAYYQNVFVSLFTAVKF